MGSVNRTEKFGILAGKGFRNGRETGTRANGKGSLEWKWVGVTRRNRLSYFCFFFLPPSPVYAEGLEFFNTPFLVRGQLPRLCLGLHVCVFLCEGLLFGMFLARDLGTTGPCLVWFIRVIFHAGFQIPGHVHARWPAGWLLHCSRARLEIDGVNQGSTRGKLEYRSSQNSRRHREYHYSASTTWPSSHA
jgi:hypothetical protein